ncbi:MAG: DMT family transporter [Anaerolineales bacterium]
MINTSLLLVIMLIVDSLHFIFARMLVQRLQPSVSASFVLVIATIEVGIYGLVTKQLRFGSLRKNAWFFLGIGFFVAGSTILNYTSVEFIDPGIASLISQTGKLWGLGLGLVWLKEKLTRQQFFGAALAIMGIFIITYQAGEYLRIGSMMVLGGTFLYAIHAGLVKKYGEEIDFVNFFFFRLLLTTIFMFLFISTTGIFTWPTPPVWKYLLLVATIDVAFSRSIYYLALRRLKLSVHTLVLTLSPVATTLWTIVFFSIYPSSKQMAGGLIILLGVFIVGKYRSTTD